MYKFLLYPKELNTPTFWPIYGPNRSWIMTAHYYKPNQRIVSIMAPIVNTISLL